eukprot:5385974-Amphidinium_carterae.9
MHRYGHLLSKGERTFKTHALADGCIAPVPDECQVATTIPILARHVYNIVWSSAGNCDARSQLRGSVNAG